MREKLLSAVSAGLPLWLRLQTLIKDRLPWEETDSPPPPEQVMELEHAPSWLSVKSIMPFMIFPQRAAGLSS